MVAVQEDVFVPNPARSSGGRSLSTVVPYSAVLSSNSPIGVYAVAVSAMSPCFGEEAPDDELPA